MKITKQTACRHAVTQRTIRIIGLMMRLTSKERLYLVVKKWKIVVDDLVLFQFMGFMGLAVMG